MTEIPTFKKGAYSIDETIPMQTEKISKDNIKKNKRKKHLFLSNRRKIFGQFKKFSFWIS